MTQSLWVKGVRGPRTPAGPSLHGIAMGRLFQVKASQATKPVRSHEPTEASPRDRSAGAWTNIGGGACRAWNWVVLEASVHPLLPTPPTGRS